MAKPKNNGVPPVDPDVQAVIDHAFRGKPLDPKVFRRIRRRAEKIRQRILREHGVQDIGVQIIREMRGELPEP